MGAEDTTTESRTWVFVAAQGIHQFQFDLENGVLTPISKNEQQKPSFLAIHPSGHALYGVGQSLSAFAIDADSGHLTLLNDIAYEQQGLCHLVVDKTGANVLCAGYGAGTVVVQRIGKDGRLGEQSAIVQHEGSSVDESRQEAPHAHSINLDEANRFAFAADLGIDQVVIYRFDASRGTLRPADQPAASVSAGAGPRHFALHPNGRYAYVINELDSTVGGFRYDAAAGRLEPIETKTTLPEGFAGKNYPAEIAVHPSGRFLYGSNRGHDSIVVYSIDPTSGRLTFVEHAPSGGKWAQHFCIDPTGQFLLVANQRSNNITVFRIDEQIGKLTATPHTIEVPGPACIRFLQARNR